MAPDEKIDINASEPEHGENLVQLYASISQGVREIRTEIEKAMAQLGHFRDDSHPGEDYHQWAGNKLLELSKASPVAMAQYTDARWSDALGGIGHLPADEGQPLPSINSLRDAALSSAEILANVRVPLSRLFKTDPQKALEYVRQLEKANSTLGYIFHMDSALHSINTERTIVALLKKSGVTLEGPYADIGCGPGHVTDRLIQKGIIPEDAPLITIDPNEDYFNYSKKLLQRGKRRNKNLKQAHSGAENMYHFAEIENNPLGTVFSSMAIQWMPREIGEKVVASAFESLRPGGVLISVGEAPVNVTAPTPYTTVTGGDIGYSEGPLSHRELCELMIRKGFRFGGFTKVPMGMNPNSRGINSAESPDENMDSIVPAYSDHIMIATIWHKD